VALLFWGETRSTSRLVTWLARVWAAVVTFLFWLSVSLYVDVFRNRPGRDSESCPSHYRRPEAGHHTLARWDTPATKLKGDGSVTMDSEAATGHHFTPPKLTAARRGKRLGTASASLHAGQCLSDLRTDRLHMDHLPLSFADVLWCSFFVYPGAFAAFVVGGANTHGLLGIMVMKLMQHLGLGKTTCSDEEASSQVFESVVGIASIAIWVTSVDEKECAATFLIPNATRIVNDTEVETGDLEIKLDLKARRQQSATFCGEAVGPHDCLALIFCALAGNVHAVVHSYANWGLNTSRAMHGFMRRMAIVTIKYNNIGVESYPCVMAMLRQLGVARHITNVNTRLTCYFNHSVPSHTCGISVEGRGCPHANLQKLQKHSEVVDFVFKVRRRFLADFQEFKKDFPGVDGEAHFIGTAMHSIDHRNGGRLVDNRVFTGMHPNKDPRFAATHEWASIAHACATDRPPRLIDLGFKHAGHPFYRKVYAYAEKLNPLLASYMEAAIAM